MCYPISQLEIVSSDISWRFWENAELVVYYEGEIVQKLACFISTYKKLNLVFVWLFLLLLPWSKYGWFQQDYYAWARWFRMPMELIVSPTFCRNNHDGLQRWFFQPVHWSILFELRLGSRLTCPYSIQDRKRRRQKLQQPLPCNLLDNPSIMYLLVLNAAVNYAFCATRMESLCMKPCWTEISFSRTTAVLVD